RSRQHTRARARKFEDDFFVLESPGLLLEWTAESAISIHEPISQALVGRAHRPVPLRWWRQWGATRDWVVCEGEDEALLFSLQWSWFLRSFALVLDAEGGPVGKIVPAAGRVLRFQRFPVKEHNAPLPESGGCLQEAAGDSAPASDTRAVAL